MSTTFETSTTFAKLAELPVEIESCSLRGLSQHFFSHDRLTTVVCLHGGGEEGLGEDITYYPDAQLEFQRAGAPDLAGTWTLAELGAHIDGLDLFATTPLFETYRTWRRWAFHSAALDLALRQDGRALHEVLGLEPRPLTFVLSMVVNDAACVDRLHSLLRRYPGLRLKPDVFPCWEDERLLEDLAALNAIETLDFKNFDPALNPLNPLDPAIYRRVAEVFPHAWLEDPDLTLPGVDAALAPYRGRITWDAPMRSVAAIQELAVLPPMVNIKPSRFGSLRELCAAYDFCAEQGIGVYAGGMLELGPGRGQVQYLASIFHPEAPNDIAPVAYNDASPPDGLPSSPLAPAPAVTGFRWEA
jgi:L-alanine-DL-glutamate epimerase-like enolase superfamily enzyme